MYVTDERLIAKLRELAKGAPPLPNTASLAADRIETMLDGLGKLASMLRGTTTIVHAVLHPEEQE